MIDKITRFQRELTSDQTYFELINFVISEQSDRIFTKGLDASDSDIGKYSDKPLYVNPNVAPRRFATKGKTGETKFKSGKPHKTGYFTGYGQYKQTIGEGSRVNLRLFRNFEVAYNTAGRFTFRDAKLIYTHAIRSSTANPVGKLEGIQSRYPKAFGLNKAERDIFKRGMEEIITKKFGG